MMNPPAAGGASALQGADGSGAHYARATGLLHWRSAEPMPLNALLHPAPEDFENCRRYAAAIVRHVQTASSRYLLRDSCIVYGATQALMFSGDPQQRLDAAADLVRSARAQEHRALGLSVADLCEGVALLESYKAVSAQPSAVSYLRYCERHFPGWSSSVQRRAFDVLANAAGVDVAFDLLPVLSWIALQGDVPGRTFALLASRPDVCSGKFIGESASRILRALGIADLLAAPLAPARLQPRDRHPILHPVLQRWQQRIDAERLLDVFARPHQGMDGAFLPPVIVCTQATAATTVSAHGVARDAKELQGTAVFMTAVGTAAARVLGGQAQPQACAHVECPNHDGRLCGGWHTPPERPDVCGFRARSALASKGRELYEIAATGAQLAQHQRLAALRASSDLATLFGQSRWPALDERIAHQGERTAIRPARDAADEDAQLLLLCPQCRSGVQDTVPQRRLCDGYRLRCLCGELIDVRRGRGNVINLSQ